MRVCCKVVKLGQCAQLSFLSFCSRREYHISTSQFSNVKDTLLFRKGHFLPSFTLLYVFFIRKEKDEKETKIPFLMSLTNSGLVKHSCVFHRKTTPNIFTEKIKLKSQSSQETTNITKI